MGFFKNESIYRYLLRQTLVATFLLTFVLTCIIWLTQSLRLLDLIINGGAPVNVFGYLLFLTVPKFLEIVIPIAFAIAALFVLNKMTSDRELIVLRAVGFSYRRIIYPLSYLAMILAVIIFILSGWLTPQSNRELDRMRDIIRSDYSAALLRDGVFTAIGKDMTLYVDARRNTEDLRGIMIHDSSQKNQPPITILAQRGVLAMRDGDPHVIVYDGVRQQFNPKTQDLETLTFDTYAINMARLEDQKINPWIDEDERTLPDLLTAYRDPSIDAKRRHLFRGEFHVRVSRPLFMMSICWFITAMFLLGSFNRRGQAGKILISIIALIVMQSLHLLTSNWAGESITGISLLYAVSIIPGVISYKMVRVLDRGIPYPIRALKTLWRKFFSSPYEEPAL